MLKLFHCYCFSQGEKKKKTRSPFFFNQGRRRQGCLSVCEWLMPHQCKQMGVTWEQCGQQSSWAVFDLLSLLVTHLFVECRKKNIHYVKKCEMKLFWLVKVSWKNAAFTQMRKKQWIQFLFKPELSSVLNARSVGHVRAGILQGDNVAGLVLLEKHLLGWSLKEANLNFDFNRPVLRGFLYPQVCSCWDCAISGVHHISSLWCKQQHCFSCLSDVRGQVCLACCACF